MKIRRSTARVLPVDRDGRVLLLLGQGLLGRGGRFWLSVGGGIERGETLPDAAARELREETGMVIGPAEFGTPVGTSVIAYSSFGLVPVIQYQTYFAVAVDDTAVSFAHQGALERMMIDRYEWLSADGLAAQPERITDPELPKMMRAAVAAVRRPAPSEEEVQ